MCDASTLRWIWQKVTVGAPNGCIRYAHTQPIDPGVGGPAVRAGSPVVHKPGNLGIEGIDSILASIHKDKLITAKSILMDNVLSIRW